MPDKILLNSNVYEESKRRIEWMFDTFHNVCISFSGGKDSTVLFHISGDIARQKGCKFSVLFIDWEAQFTHTINHVCEMKKMYHDVIDVFYWVALPLTTVNGVSQITPEWIAWEKDLAWIRLPPEGAITNEEYFPFYNYAMTFEEFIPAFSEWLSDNKGMIMATGMRADESLNRFMSIASQKKLRYADDKPWTTGSKKGFYYTASPLYDWKFSDIWVYNARYSKIYNPIYELMYQAGVPLGSMRICEPFRTEQRRGLWLYHILEPLTWEKMCFRVAGAHSGSIYCNQSGPFFALNSTVTKPSHFTWKEYAYFLLDSMPEKTAEHYKNKIAIYIRWYKTHGFILDIPDQQDKDLGYKDIPSWRRICKTLLKNDFWCRTLSFSPNKSSNYDNYLKRIKGKRKLWGGI
ncbi:DUF3440 domain-containing protein [Salmonella enterica]|nr:DUF3440 domain-containing protein [Salmonella enterica]